MNVRSISILLLLTSCIGIMPVHAQDELSPAQRSAKAREYFINGTTLQLQGNRHAEAILEFQESLKYDSSSTTMTAIARSFLELRKLDRAESFVRRSIELDERNRDSWELLAEILIASGRYDEGVAAYEKVRGLSPTKRQLYTLGRLYEPRDAKRSIDVFEQICKTDPDVGILRRLASLYGRIKDTEGQRRSLDRALALSPDNEDVTEELVALNVQEGRVSDAHDLCRTWTRKSTNLEASVRVWATLLDELANDSLVTFLYADDVRAVLDDIPVFYPKVFPLLSMGGGLALSIRDVERADTLFDRAAILAEGIAEPLLQIGGLYITFDFPKEAVVFLQKHQPKHPSDPRFLLLIADAYMNMQDQEKALVHFYAALDLDPSIVEAWLQIAMIYDGQGRSDSSDAAYERVLSMDPRNMFACNNYAYALAVRGQDLERARELGWTALQQNPQNPAYLDTYAWVLFRSGEHEQALKFIKRAIELEGNPTHYEHLGDILEATGDISAAVEAWSTSLEKDPQRTYLRTKIDRYR